MALTSIIELQLRKHSYDLSSWPLLTLTDRPVANLQRLWVRVILSYFKVKNAAFLAQRIERPGNQHHDPSHPTIPDITASQRL